MLSRVVFLVLLAGCAAQQHDAVPVELRACPEAPEAPPSLPRIVSPEGLRTLYWRERSARLEAVEALNECADRLAAVIHTLQGIDQ